jgi:carbonic anhydrase/acetyltransferase-like protein (isoleucine patch superfamily)
LILSFKNITPSIHPSCFIADNSTIIGNVKLEEDCSVWFETVIRGDTSAITVGRGSNIQDNATLHGDKGFDLTIGKGVTIGHNAIVHGACIGDNVLVGMGAIIMNGADIGSNSIIGAGAVITEKQVIPDNSLVVGLPGKVIRTLSPEYVERIKWNASHYVELSKEYMK